MACRFFVHSSLLRPRNIHLILVDNLDFEYCGPTRAPSSWPSPSMQRVDSIAFGTGRLLTPTAFDNSRPCERCDVRIGGKHVKPSPPRQSRLRASRTGFRNILLGTAEHAESGRCSLWHGLAPHSDRMNKPQSCEKRGITEGGKHVKEHGESNFRLADVTPPRTQPTPSCL